MREKTPSERRPALPEPPRELRRFGTVYDDGRGLGRDVYPDRAAWVAARHVWAQEHGLTVTAWWAALMELAAETARGLDELNLPFADEWFVEADEDEDPRLTA